MSALLSLFFTLSIFLLPCQLCLRREAGRGGRSHVFAAAPGDGRRDVVSVAGHQLRRVGNNCRQRTRFRSSNSTSRWPSPPRTTSACSSTSSPYRMLDSVLRRRAAYASATLVALPPGERAAAALAAAAAVALAAAAAALAANAAAAGCCRGCRSCGDSTGMASSTCSLRERGALAPCR
uniref:Uncharacterized protein n=1 Tax=Oryza sativa subsp. japonica TaxID=39947 RepID=Q33A26_ORYSJ|nr:hypothetical protein LOC_Os10g16620 [Oryza sativa Japonica Group]